MQKLAQILRQNCIISWMRSGHRTLALSLFGGSLVLALAANNCLWAADDPIDGTLVWVGDSAGGNWSDEANWQVGGGSTATVAELLGARTIYDLSALADGASLTSDWTKGNSLGGNFPADTLPIRGLIVGGEARTINVWHGSGAQRWRFCNGTTVDIENATLRLEPYVNTAAYPYQTLRKSGSGKLRLMRSISFWEADPSLEILGGTVALADGFKADNAVIMLHNGGTLTVEANGKVQLGRIYSADAAVADQTSVLRVESGATLFLDVGFTGSGTLKAFAGNIEGDGAIRFAGGQAYNFNVGAKTDPLAFTGTLDVLNADAIFGTPEAPQLLDPATKFDIRAGGFAVLYGDQKLVTMPAGNGATGGILVEKNGSLTFDSPAIQSCCNARIAGAGAIVKDGAANELVFDNPKDYTGATVVKAGTLSVDTYKPVAMASGAHWDFENEYDMGRDASAGGGIHLVAEDPSKYAFVADGVVGRAVHWDKATNIPAAVLTNEAGIATGSQLPKGYSSVTISLWVRPAQDCGWYPNLVTFGDLSGGNYKQYVVAFSLYPSGDSRANGLGKRVAFYPFVGWSARGADAAVAELGDEGYSIVDGKWHHIVCTFDINTLLASIYVDGVLKGTKQQTYGLKIIDNPGIKIGNASLTDAHSTYSGDIDEVKVLPGAWTAEQVAAEYATRGLTPVPEGDASPVAEWNFDACEAEGSGSFADSVSGLRLVSVSENGTEGVVAGVGTAETRDGRQFKFAMTGAKYDGSTRVDASALRLAEGDGEKLAQALPAGSSFTVSARLPRQPGTGIFMIIGDGSETGSVRMEYVNATPRRITWFVGNGSRKLLDQGEFDIHIKDQEDTPSGWVQCSVAYDAEAAVVRYYLEGVEIYAESRTLPSINFKDIVFGARARDSETGALSQFVATTALTCRIDNLALFDQALSADEIRAHARSVIGIAADATVLPTASPVTVESGAVLRVKNGNENLQSLSGAGDVEISRGSSLTLNALDGFTGRIRGPGELFLGGKAQLPAAVAVENPITIASITTDSDGTTLPMVDGRDKVSVAATGVFVLEDEVQAVPKLYPIARNVGEYVLPEDASGWQLVPAAAHARLAFVVRDGVLYARVSGKAMIIRIR
ncbi:MAG: LamG-like jellyroll fold domain-containing protein [Kiritimatiellia bacterium]